MRVIYSPQQIQKICLQFRSKGKSIGFVPTMGYLHEGHQTLLRIARKKSDIVILSIFVNPTQFAPNEDLSRYPRDTKGDLAKARKEKVDFVFFPTPESIYPENFQTQVRVEKVAQGMCGGTRPTHFAGVALVVLKLFNLVQPTTAYFGLKDFQQFTVISQMVRDLNVPIKIVGVPTVREKDGLAMSSRNVYLNPEERKAALALSQSLAEVKAKVKKGEVNLFNLVDGIRSRLVREPLAQIDYISCVDAYTMVPLQKYQKGKTLFALAVFIGKTRLIDNLLV